MLARKGSLRRAYARPCALRAVPALLLLRRAAPAGSTSFVPILQCVNYVLITSVNHVLELDTGGPPHSSQHARLAHDAFGLFANPSCDPVGVALLELGQKQLYR